MRSRSIPRVSVLMPVRNGAETLGEAIESIRRQTLPDWELIVVDDGSEDGTADLVRKAARQDPRVRLFRQPPLGLVAALNRAVAEACGELLARLDADDRARPDRLLRQVSHMDRHPEVGVLGGAVQRFGAKRGIWRFPTPNDRLKATLIFGTPFAHPAVIFRAEVMRTSGGGYREEFRAAEDLDLWERLAGSVNFANLPDVVIDYRVHSGQVTAQHRTAMMKNGAKVRLRLLEGAGLSVGIEQQRLHECMAGGRVGSLESLAATGDWLRTVVETCGNRIAPIEAVQTEVALRWADFCSLHRDAGLGVWKAFRAGLPSGSDFVPWRRRAWLLTACLVGGARG